MELDFYLFQKINSLAGESLWLDTIVIFLGQYFEYVLILLLTLLLIINSKKYFKMDLEVFFGAVLAKEIFVDVIRQVLPRARPFVENQIYLLIDNATTPAFPSAHAAFYFAMATVVYLHNKKLGSLFFLSALLISVARVFSGVHWPSDIFAGSLVGIFSGFLVHTISKKFPK